MNSSRLSGFTVFVTGAGGLLGREHCAAVIQNGGHVVAIDNESQGLEDLLKQHEDRSRIRTCVLDITNEEQTRAIVTRELGIAQECLGLVNNAAVNPKAEGDRASFNRLETMSISQWNHELSVGLTGSLIMTQIVGEEMARRGQGSIVHVSSDHGIIAPDQNLYGGPESERVKPVTYSVVKHGLIGLSRYVATYWAHRGVRSNALCPGGVLQGQDDDFLTRFKLRVPLGRMADSSEYQGALTFLLSDDSSYMTGATLVVDGGRSAW